MSDPIPSWLWEKLKTFMADERTGTLTLGINQGRVKDYEFREFGKIKEDVDNHKEQCIP